MALMFAEACGRAAKSAWPLAVPREQRAGVRPRPSCPIRKHRKPSLSIPRNENCTEDVNRARKKKEIAVTNCSFKGYGDSHWKEFGGECANDSVSLFLVLAMNHDVSPYVEKQRG